MGESVWESLIAKVICNAVKNRIVSADRFRFNDIELLKLSLNKYEKLIGKEISHDFPRAAKLFRLQ